MAMKLESKKQQFGAVGSAEGPAADRLPLSYEDLPPKQQERWDRIVDVTHQLVISRDCNIEVREIADASGLAMGTVYRYFHSKEVLFAEMYYRWRARFEQEIGDATGRKETSADKVQILLTKTIEQIEKFPQFGDLAIAVRSSRNPTVMQQRWKMEARTARLMKQLIKDVPAEDVDGLMWLITSSFLQSIEAWRAGDITIREVHSNMHETVRLTLRR